MKRSLLRKIHVAAASIATLCIAVFWSSTVIAELFASHETVANLKRAIFYAFVLFIPAMATTGSAGMKLGGKSQYAPIARKRHRMPIIAANGIFILIPCAFFLDWRASAGLLDATFYAVQALELAAGALNFTLMILSARDGRALRSSKAS